MVEGDLSD
jgi:hypothetical protein